MENSDLEAMRILIPFAIDILPLEEIINQVPKVAIEAICNNTNPKNLNILPKNRMKTGTQFEES